MQLFICGSYACAPDHAVFSAATKIKAEFPSAVLIGEAWMLGIKRKELKTINIKNRFFKWIFGAASDSLLREYVGELDGVLDFKFQEIIKNYIQHSDISKQTLYKVLKRHYAHFPDNYFLPTFLDNHDMDRFLFLCGNDKEKLKAAAQIQFSMNQPAIIYYGTETGMTQTTSMWDISYHGDLQARQPMNWKTQDTNLKEFYKKKIKQKKSMI